LAGSARSIGWSSRSNQSIAFELLERPQVQIDNQPADSLVEFGEVQEAMIAQTCQDLIFFSLTYLL
jgi:hypothetical protein